MFRKYTFTIELFLINIFSISLVLGHMSWQTGIPVDKVAIGGPELAFIVYPEGFPFLFFLLLFFLPPSPLFFPSFFFPLFTLPSALSLLPYPYVFSVMFFAMMMLLGIDSAFAIVEVLSMFIYLSRENRKTTIRDLSIYICLF